jgi:hypothetical protein
VYKAWEQEIPPKRQGRGGSTITKAGDDGGTKMVGVEWKNVKGARGGVVKLWGKGEGCRN